MKADPVIQTNGAPVASADSDRYARHARVAGGASLFILVCAVSVICRSGCTTHGTLLADV